MSQAIEHVECYSKGGIKDQVSEVFKSRMATRIGKKCSNNQKMYNGKGSFQRFETTTAFLHACP
ncbi:MAG TPA: hypothetical protein VD908_07290 [Cytophagales bacterium]|nr:hypothetical protein [Cytophagales bacterium]